MLGFAQVPIQWYSVQDFCSFNFTGGAYLQLPSTKAVPDLGDCQLNSRTCHSTEGHHMLSVCRHVYSHLCLGACVTCVRQQLLCSDHEDPEGQPQPLWFDQLYAMQASGKSMAIKHGLYQAIAVALLLLGSVALSENLQHC